MVRIDKRNIVHMDTFEKQATRQLCPQLWADARYQSIEVIHRKEIVIYNAMSDKESSDKIYAKNR